jgi:hypothetical protein
LFLAFSPLPSSNAIPPPLLLLRLQPVPRLLSLFLLQIVTMLRLSHASPPPPPLQKEEGFFFLLFCFFFFFFRFVLRLLLLRPEIVSSKTFLPRLRIG